MTRYENWEDATEKERREQLQELRRLTPKITKRLQEISGKSHVAERDLIRLLAVGQLALYHPEDDIIEDAAVGIVKLREADSLAAQEAVSRGEPLTIPSPDPRFDALAEIQALLVAEEEPVRQWRDTYLPEGRLLARGEVLGFIDTLWQQEPFERTATLVIDGSQLPAEIDPDILGTIEVDVGPGILLDHGNFWLSFLSPLGAGNARGVSYTGPLGELRRLVNDLTDRCMWPAHEATMFVLTGAVPRLNTLSLFLEEHEFGAQRITIRVDPRTPTRELAAAYDELRAIFAAWPELPQPSSSAQKTRTLTPRTARLAVFLAQHRMNTWNEMSERWNREHPQWPSKSFRREALKAWERVVGQPFTKPRAPADSPIPEAPISGFQLGHEPGDRSASSLTARHSRET